MLSRSKCIIGAVIFCVLSFIFAAIGCFAPYVAEVKASDGTRVNAGLLFVGQQGTYKSVKFFCNESHSSTCEAMEDTLATMFSLHTIATVCALLAACAACCRIVIFPFVLIPTSLFLQCTSTFGYLFRGVPLLQETIQSSITLRDTRYEVEWTFWIIITGIFCMFMALVCFAAGFKYARLDSKHNPKKMKRKPRALPPTHQSPAPSPALHVPTPIASPVSKPSPVESPVQRTQSQEF